MFLMYLTLSYYFLYLNFYQWSISYFLYILMSYSRVIYNMSMTSITLWRSEIGNFYNCSHNVRGIKSHSLSFDIDFCSIQRVLTFFGIFFSELMNINLIFMQRLIIILMTNLLYSRFRKYFRVYYYFHTNWFLFLTASVYVHNFYLYFILLMRSGDINPNPGPRSSTWECLSICHWNLNSLSSHSFIKKGRLTALNLFK